MRSIHQQSLDKKGLPQIKRGQSFQKHNQQQEDEYGCYCCYIVLYNIIKNHLDSAATVAAATANNGNANISTGAAASTHFSKK